MALINKAWRFTSPGRLQRLESYIGLKLIKNVYMSEKKSLLLPIIWGAGIAAMIIIAISVFLTTSDCYGLPGETPKCITGWEVLSLEWPAFWHWVIGCSVVGVACLIIAYNNESGAGKLGRSLQGKTGLTWALVIIGVILLFGPWAKGCENKVDAGITAPGHKVEQPAP